jgi:hypothetical protein
MNTVAVGAGAACELGVGMTSVVISGKTPAVCLSCHATQLNIALITPYQNVTIQSFDGLKRVFPLSFDR